MIDFIGKIVNSPITLGFVAAIATWFLAGIRRQHRMHKTLKNDLEKLEVGMETIGFARVQSLSQLNQLDELFRDSPKPLQLAWSEYQEAITTVERAGQTLVRNTEQPSNFFELSRLNEDWGNQNLSSIGGSLMTLGILGTFVGLTTGLYGFKMGGVDEVRTSIAGLIDGMQTSFVTSVFGIFFGIVYTATFRRARSQTRHAFEKFISKIDHIFQRQTSEEIQEAYYKEAQEQTKILSHLSEDFALSLNQAFENKLVPAISEMNTTLGSIGETTLRNQSEAMDSMVGEFLAKMTDSLESNFKELASQLENAVERAERFGGSLEESHRSLSEMVSKQESLHSQIESLIHNTKEVLHGSHDYLQKMTDVNNNLTEVANSFNNSSGLVTEQLKNLTALSTEFMESSKNFQESSQHMNEIWERHRTTVNESLNTLDNGIKSYTHQTTANLGESLSRFEDSLNEGVELFGSASTALASNLGDLEDFFQELHTRMKNWENRSRSLERTSSHNE